MLKEFVHIRQESGEGRRRWFESDEMELVVWLDANGAIDGYQICYEVRGVEHALTWRPGVGFAHSSVDSGDTPMGGSKMTPILLPDGAVPWAEVERRFEKNSGALETDLQTLVSGTLAARR